MSPDIERHASAQKLYKRVNDIVRRDDGYEPFVVHGRLLELLRVRSSGDDLDFGVAYLSRHGDGRETAVELRDIGLAVIDAGLEAELQATVLNIHDSDTGSSIELFHLYFDGDGRLTAPSAATGDTTVTQSWRSDLNVAVAGRFVGSAETADPFTTHIDQSHRHTPLLKFARKRSRLRRSADGACPPPFIEEIYWANFYAHHELNGGSTFYDALSARADLPQTVLDIGCGDGRDSWAFARSGRRVIGLDRSEVGIRHAMAKAEKSGLRDLLSFRAVDVSDSSTLRAALDAARDAAGDAPLLFYLRFFLHSIPEDVQETLLTALCETARDADVFAAEFRTEEDEANPKAYGNHYRRFQNGRAFGRTLQERYGFTVLDEEEGTGLSPYALEDPYLYRVVARRGARPTAP